VYITMLTPARNANSRWRGSPAPSAASAALLSCAQAPARSFDVIRIDDTPSPPRAGRSGSSSFGGAIARPRAGLG